MAADSSTGADKIIDSKIANKNNREQGYDMQIKDRPHWLAMLVYKLLLTPQSQPHQVAIVNPHKQDLIILLYPNLLPKVK